MIYLYDKVRLANSVAFQVGQLVNIQLSSENGEMTCRVTADTIAVPSAPSGLVATALGGGIFLNWADNAVADAVTGYQVFRSTNQGGPYSSLGTPSVSQYTDSTATTGVTYWYHVIAINTGGNSDYSEVTASFTVDSTAPSNVVILSTELTGATSVTVTWTPPGDSDLAGFNVYRSTTENGSYTKLNTTGLVTANTYTNTTATAGSTWWYKVTSVDVTGNESTGVKTTYDVPALDTTAPAVPTGLVALDTHSELTVTWTANTESDLASYSIFRSDDGYTTALATGLPLTPTKYLDSSATIGVSYTYKVLAKDGTGNSSAKSSASNAATRTADTTSDLTAFMKIGSMVPCVVHARGVDFTQYRASGDGKTITFTETNDFPDLANGTALTARYDWNMCSGANEPQGNYPTGRGFNYAHAYDQAGQYTIKLTRTDDTGVSRVFSKKVTFVADTRRTVYCSNDGTDATSNDGSNQASPVSISRAATILQGTSNVKVYLRRGDVFNITGTAFTLSKANQMVSSIGTFVKPGSSTTKLPTLNLTKASTGGERNVVYVTKTATNAVVESFSIDETYGGTVDQRLLDCGVRVDGDGNTLVRNITFTKVGKPFKSDDTPSTRYALVIDCRVPNNDSMIFNFSFAKGADHVYLGIVAVNSMREHIIRMSQVDRICIAYCNLTNRELDADDTSKTATNFQQGSYCYIYKNTLTADIGTVGSVYAGTCQIGPLNKDTATLEAYCKLCVMEENFINAMIEIEDGASEVMVRNNVITKNESWCFQIFGHGEGVDAYGRSLVPRINDKVYIYNNTLINNGKNGQLLRVKHKFNNFEFINNLLIAPNQVNGSGGGIVNKSISFNEDLGTGNVIKRNIINGLDQIKVNATTYSTGQFNNNGGISNAKEVVSVIASTGKPTFVTTPNQTLARPQKGVFQSINLTERVQSDSTWTPGSYQL